MSFYQVDNSQLRAKKDELISLIQRFISEKEELVSKETALRSMWEGAANESFHTRFVKDSQLMTSFVELLGRYVSVMESIADRYDLAEEKNTGRAV